MHKYEKSSEAIDAIRAHLKGLKKYFESPVNCPVTGHELDLESRAGDKIRQFKHIHQYCSVAQFDLHTALYMRMLLTLESYLTLYDGRCGLHLYAIARSVMELHGLSNRVSETLLAYRSGDISDWRSRGEGFFKYLVRARYGTRDPEIQRKLLDLGISKKCMVPIHSKDIEAAIFSLPEFENDRETYAMLCDYVHTNAQGFYVGSPGWFEAGTIRAQGQVFFQLPEPGPVTRYEYPTMEGFDEAVAVTAPIVDRHLLGFKAAIEKMPSSPYSDQEVRDQTGLAHGMPVLPLNTLKPVKTRFRDGPKVGRNDPCPCGSGKKYKTCCLN
ncbi:SEC-C metal-binding domain-containing protein [Pseudomonadota bacterium]